MNRRFRNALLVCSVLTLSNGVALADNDLSTSYRAGSISVPSVDEEPNNASTVAVNQGRAGYSIPIVVPPGRAGVEPSLALTYHGGRNEGVVGAGWSLSTPSIRVRLSGRGGQPRWGTAVRYLGASGEELVGLAAPLADQDGDGLEETVYREERDTQFIRYVQLSAGGWRMDYPDGRKLTLGTTADARIARAGYPSHIARWLPEVLVDTSGNELRWTWSDGATVAAAIGSASYNLVARYLTEMRWGCQACDAATTYQSVALTYEDRVNHVTDLSAGYLVETEFQIASIDTATTIGGVAVPIRTYDLVYDLSQTRVLLESVSVTGADGTSLPPTTLRYTDRDAPVTPSAPASNPGLSFRGGVQAIDVDLDGRVDVVDFGNVAAGADYHRNDGASGAGFGPVAAIALPPGVSLSAGGTASAEDATRDVAIDVFDLSTGDLYPHNGASGWGSRVAATLPPIVASQDSVRVDVNADGYVDLIDTSVSPWVAYLDDGSRTYTDDTIVFASDLTPNYGGTLHAASAGVVFGDLNGDGLVDVLHLDGGGALVHFFPGRGVSGFGWLSEDGRAASFTTLTITAGGGIGPSIGETALADIDGDGFGDLVSFDAGSSRLRVFLRLPGAGFNDAGTGSPFTQSIAANDGCRVADWDHDGASEILCSSGWQLYDFADRLPFMLREVDNGLGHVTRVSYTTSARVAAAHESAGTPWSQNVSMAMPIVETTESDDSRGNVLVTRYDYRDATYEADELEDRFEFIGFGYIEAERIAYLETTPGDALTRIEDPQDPGDRVRRFYDVGVTDYFQRGMLDCVETWDRSAVLPAGFTCDVAATGPLLRVVSTHSSATDGDGITTLTVDAQDRYVLEGGPVASGAWLRTEYGYDDVGNRTSVLRFGLYSGSDDATGDDETMVVTDFVRNRDDWILRRPRLAQRGGVDLSGFTPAIVAVEETCRIYDGVTALCDDLYDGSSDALVTQGLVTSSLRYTDHDLGDGVPGVDTVVETTTYTANGLPAQITNPDGVRELTYDLNFGLFRASETLDPGGLGLVTLFRVNPTHGQLLGVTQPDGTFTRARYDRLGRMTRLIRMGDTPAAPTVTRTYAMGAPSSLITDTVSDGTPDGLVTERWIDGDGRLLCQRKEGAGGPDIETQREYTARGLTALTYLPTRAAGCDVALRTVAGRSTARFHDAVVYDALSRPTTLTHQPSGTFSTTAYGVLSLTVSDEEDTHRGPHFDTPTTSVSDGLGRVVSVFEEGDSDGDGSPESHEMRYTYDALDHVLAVTDVLGATVFEAAYDSRGRRVWSRDADRGDEVATYDDLDRPSTGTDARGHTITYTYDAAGRVTTVAADDLVSVETTTYRYDAQGIPAVTAGCHYLGRLARVEDPSGETRFCYDARGRVITERTTIDAYAPTPLITRRTFDGLDRLETLTHPDGTVLTYGYDDGGRANHLTVDSGGASYPMVTAATYTAGGQLRGMTYGNGAVVTIRYDDRLRPRRHRAFLGGAPELDSTLTLDHIGNVDAIADAVGNRSATFAYDDWNRMVQAEGDLTGGETLSYAYDLRGNLTSRSSTDPTSPLHVEVMGYNHASALHALTEVDRDGDGVDDELFVYDASGNISEDGRYAFGFGATGMLRTVDEVATGTAIVDYTYDYLQRRVVSEYESGDAVYFIRAANAELRDIGGNPVMRKHIAFGPHTIGVVEDTFVVGTEEDHIFLYGFDHLGAPAVVFDVAAAPSVVEQWASYPFGAENPGATLADYRDPSDSTSVLSRRFQGREIDGVVPDFYDFGARVYRSDLGRFLSADTIVPEPGASQSWNRYAFVRNNPLSRIDPDGHEDVPASGTPAGARATDGTAIVMAFTDYQVAIPNQLRQTTVGGQQVGQLVPQTMPFGHGGILLIADGTGSDPAGRTRYWEYGRYPGPGAGVPGLVENRTVPDVVIGNDGEPTLASLSHTLSVISSNHGQGRSIEGVYIDDLSFSDMESSAQSRKANNLNASRAPYNILRNNCITFPVEIAQAGGARALPPSLVYSPDAYVGTAQTFNRDVHFDANTGQATTDR